MRSTRKLLGIWLARRIVRPRRRRPGRIKPLRVVRVVSNASAHPNLRASNWRMTRRTVLEQTQRHFIRTNSRTLLVRKKDDHADLYPRPYTRALTTRASRVDGRTPQAYGWRHPARRGEGRPGYRGGRDEAVVVSFLARRIPAADHVCQCLGAACDGPDERAGDRWERSRAPGRYRHRHSN